MDKKVMIIGAVAVVAIVAVAAVAIVLMNNQGSEDNRNAKEMANDFLKKYDGSFGEFKLSDDSTDDLTIMMYMYISSVQSLSHVRLFVTP